MTVNAISHSKNTFSGSRNPALEQVLQSPASTLVSRAALPWKVGLLNKCLSEKRRCHSFRLTDSLPKGNSLGGGAG